MNLVRSIYKKVFPKNNSTSQPDVIKEWVLRGKPAPPPHLVKQEVISEARIRHGHKIFIETGTYLGEMVEAQKNNFEKIYSIELGDDLYKNAVEKFKTDKNIFLFQGDSGKVLCDLLLIIEEPAIFWLDGHYSEGITAQGNLDTPILEELELILNHKIEGHIILIDDARCFDGQGDYPGVDFLRNLVKKKNDQLQFTVVDDIIRIY